MKWKPFDHRESYLQDDGSLLQYYISQNSDESSGSGATQDVGTIVECWLCGLDKEIEPLIEIAQNCLALAIETGDVAGPGGYQGAKLYEAKAMCGWLSCASNDIDAWKAAMLHYSSKLVNGKPPRGNLAKDYVEQILPACVFAGEYERGITEFEHFCGAKSLSLTKIWRPREFAYALCLHHLRGEFSKDELFAAGKKMLRSYVDDEWLYNGAYREAAIWLRLVYSFGAPELPPIQTLLSVYEVMGELLPDFVGEKKLK